MIPIQTHGRTACAGAYNAFGGKLNQDIGTIYNYVAIDGRKYTYGKFTGMPAIGAYKCTTVGVYQGLDGGLVYQHCRDLRTKTGNSNPSSFT